MSTGSVYPGFSAPLPSGVSLGSMGEGGGQNFYMAEDHNGSNGDEDSRNNSENAELKVIDSVGEESSTRHRQQLEAIITGNNTWIDPWTTPPSQRSQELLIKERQDINKYGKNQIKSSSTTFKKRIFIVNA